MTKEEKDLLFNDLCSRLPYDVKVRRIEHVCEGTIESVETLNVEWLKEFSDNVVLKPYLFPLSSMTEEQKKFFKDRPIFLDFENELVVKEDFFGNSQFTMLDDWMEVILWLVKNHFDYRGMIPKGLAIDCTNLNIY